jgi:hypothetical protein
VTVSKQYEDWSRETHLQPLEVMRTAVRRKGVGTRKAAIDVEYSSGRRWRLTLGVVADMAADVVDILAHTVRAAYAAHRAAGRCPAWC